jgi:hypothetical protein
MTKPLVTAIALCVAILLEASAPAPAFTIPIPGPSASPSPGSGAVPAPYRGLYTSLQNSISAANRTLNSIDQGQSNPLTFGSELLYANGNRGPALLAPDAIDGVRMNLDALQAVGVQGVTVAVSYPLILPSFPSSEQYLAFFEQVAQEVRSRGLKLNIEVGPIFPDQGIAVSYRGLTMNRLISDKHQIAQIIVNDLEPDYLDLGAEPDTEAKLLGLAQLNTPSGWKTYVSGVLPGLSRGGTRIAAGIGSWGNIAIAKALMPTDLDAIVIHFYPITPQFMSTAIQVAAMAHRSGKAVTLDEAWLYKSQQFTPTSGFNNAYNVFRLDPFSFWAPLDQQYLATMVRLCRLANIEYLSPFWSLYFFAYLDYTPALGAASFDQIRAISQQAAAQAEASGAVTGTGEFYKSLVSQ